MSACEVGMLLCFGASWPFSIYKTWKTKSCGGKSLIFLSLVWVGYLCGIVHKVLFSRDLVILFYALNAAMVLADLVLCLRYTRRERIQLAGARGA
jgi:hypothetical protein